MKKIVLLSFLIVLAACAGQRRIPPKTNNDTEDWRVNFPLVKRILKKVSHDVRNAHHLIVICQKSTNFQDIGSKRFKAVVYNEDNKQQYFLKNDSSFFYSIEKVVKSDRFRYNGFIYNHYLNGKLPLLKSREQHISDAAFITYIYDISFADNETLVYELSNVIFDGKGNSLTKEYFYRSPVDMKPDDIEVMY